MTDSRRPTCVAAQCLTRAEVAVTRSMRRTAEALCDRHAMAEALLAERFGYDLLIEPLAVAQAKRRQQLQIEQQLPPAQRQSATCE